MRVLIIQRMPPMFTAERYAAVTERLGDEPPVGLISHTLGTSEGRSVIVDVWSSADDFEAFREGRLNPALKEAVGAEVFAQLPPTEREFYEVHDHQQY